MISESTKLAQTVVAPVHVGAVVGEVELKTIDHEINY